MESQNKNKTEQGRTRSYSDDSAYMQAGLMAERIAMAWLRSRPEVHAVCDMRLNEQFQKRGVDFEVVFKNGDVEGVDVKHDTHLGKSDRVLFEVLRVNHLSPSMRAGVLGWGFRSDANYFVFWAPAVTKLYICNVDKMRECVQKFAKEQQGKVTVRWIATDELKSTLVMLIPWDKCKEAFKIFDVPESMVEAARNDG